MSSCIPSPFMKGLKRAKMSSCIPSPFMNLEIRTYYYADPSDLRFTKSSIPSNFSKPYQDFSLVEALDEIQRGSMEPSDFPTISVYRDEKGIQWSKDNRRLWVFRKAGLTRIEVKYTSKWFSKVPPPGTQRHKMAKPDFFPAVKSDAENSETCKIQ